jgi:hypothetical protein
MAAIIVLIKIIVQQIVELSGQSDLLVLRKHLYWISTSGSQ